MIARCGIFSVIFVFFSILFADAQAVIEGIVCDKITKMPVTGVYVVLDGTTNHGITDASGRFELKMEAKSNTKIALYHSSYTGLFVDNILEMPDTLFLEENINVISELAITANRNRREKIVERTVIMEFIIEDDSISHLKLIRSSGYASIDAIALHFTVVIIEKEHLARGVLIRAKSKTRFDRNYCPNCSLGAKGGRTRYRIIR